MILLVAQVTLLIGIKVAIVLVDDMDVKLGTNLSTSWEGDVLMWCWLDDD